MSNRCQRPALLKPGWECSREAGHDGPCAAWPTDVHKYPTDDETDMVIESLDHAIQLIEGHVHINPEQDNAMLQIALDWINKAKLSHQPPKPTGFGRFGAFAFSRKH